MAWGKRVWLVGMLGISVAAPTWAQDRTSDSLSDSAPSSQVTEGTVQGRVIRVDNNVLYLFDPRSKQQMALVVSDNSLIWRDRQLADLNAVQPGASVRVAYLTHGDQLDVVRIDLYPAGEASLPTGSDLPTVGPPNSAGNTCPNDYLGSGTGGFESPPQACPGSRAKEAP